MEKHLLAHHLVHFGQAQGTPFTTPPLSNLVDFTGESDFCQKLREHWDRDHPQLAFSHPDYDVFLNFIAGMRILACNRKFIFWSFYVFLCFAGETCNSLFSVEVLLTFLPLSASCDTIL
jgi:hypothetical protein